jgi:hypothetical protein
MKENFSKINKAMLFKSTSAMTVSFGHGYVHTEIRTMVTVRNQAAIDWLFSSPELKAQVSFSDQPASVCKLLHFRFFLQNHAANFNQTWHKSSLVEGDSGLFKQRG